MEATRLQPFEVDVPTEEQNAEYDAWLQAKVQQSLDSPGPGIPNDVVMTRIRGIIARARQVA